MASEMLPLRDGAHVAVIGGGPAGTLFAHFLLREAESVGLRLHVTIYDGKGFAEPGLRGCNQSAGVVARNFADEVRAAGIGLPANVVQRRISGYWLETDVGSVRLEPPDEREEIVTVYRGNGPRGATFRNNVSFDDHLLAFVRSEGVRVVPCNVSALKLPRSASEPCVVAFKQEERTEWEAAELVVGAFGVNSQFAGYVARLGIGYQPPATVGSIQAEARLGHEAVDAYFGDAIAVYFLDLPGVRHAALTPKHDYVTMTLIGEGVAEGQLRALLEHQVVRRRLAGRDLTTELACRCRPRVLVSSAGQPYADRIVMIGDAAVSRLYKNGLQSSLITARAAAAVAARYGVSRQAFGRHYFQVCRAIAEDNQWGRFLFSLHSRFTRSPQIMRRLLLTIQREQAERPPGDRPACAIMWEILSGTRPYAQIARHLLKPTLYGHLVNACAGQR